MSPIGLISLEQERKFQAQIVIISRNFQYWLTLLDPYNRAYLKNVLLTILIAVWNINVSYTMVCTPCLGEVYFKIRNKSGCFCETSFLKAGLCCIQGEAFSNAGNFFLLTNPLLRACSYGGEPARLPGWPGRRDSFHLVFIWRNSSPLAKTEI